MINVLPVSKISEFEDYKVSYMALIMNALWVQNCKHSSAQILIHFVTEHWLDTQ